MFEWEIDPRDMPETLTEVHPKASWNILAHE